MIVRTCGLEMSQSLATQHRMQWSTVEEDMGALDAAGQCICPQEQPPSCAFNTGKDPEDIASMLLSRSLGAAELPTGVV